MTDLPIPASAIEAAAREINLHCANISCEECERDAEAALRAAFEELGMERNDHKSLHCDGWAKEGEYRLVSKWMGSDAP